MKKSRVKTEKPLFIVTIILLCLLCSACGEKENRQDEKKPVSVTGAAESVSPVATETPEPDDITQAPTETPTPTITEFPEPIITHEPLPDGIVAVELDATSIKLSWNSDEPGDYSLLYREKGGNEWISEPSDGTSASADGLKNGTLYELQVLMDGIVLIDGLEFSTKTEGTGDPFKDIYGTIVVGDSRKDVALSSKEGCFCAKVWPQHDCYYYGDPELTTEQVKLKGGTVLLVSECESGYCYLRENGRYSLYVSGSDESGNAIDGWVDADLMFIDICDIFTPDNYMYGIQVNRTNAYYSIFTAGGSVITVDYESDSESRYDSIMDSNNIFTESGYNVISGITGKPLPNYGPPDQMPVIWDLALELIVCQKNALKKGTILMIYDGYRPNSTSHAVCDAVVGNGYLSTTVNGTNLSKGFGSVNYGPKDYIGYNSRHNKGVAVDLTLIGFSDVDIADEELAMQTKMHTLDFRCNMLYNNDNANLLYEIMTTGTYLEPLSSRAEWWHFQLKNNAKIFPQINTYIYADYAI